MLPFGGLTHQVETDQKVIALTFDDSPTENVDDIIALLKKYGIQATFFKKLVEEGHQI